MTSLTTAGAFFASASSSIAAIRCFGVFCGLVVICDWLVMIFFLPPLAVLYERHVKTLCCTLQSKHCVNTPMAADDRQLQRTAIGSVCTRCLGPLLTHRLVSPFWVLAMLALAILVGWDFLQEGFRLP